jgi:2'-5' RNA ligase
MRCFITIDLPEKVRKYLLEIQRKFEFVSGKFVEFENLHLTIKFLDEVKESDLKRIEDKLKTIQSQKIIAKLGNLGVFPSKISPHILWISLEPRDEVKELKEAIDLSLNNFDFKYEKKFKSHLTLARIKSIKDKNNFLNLLDQVKIVPMEFEINSFVLKKSTLTKNGPIYEDLVRINLI